MEKQEKKGKMTLDDLARMTQEGFLEMRHNFGELRSEVRRDINEVRQDIQGIKAQISGIDRRIDDIAANKVGYKELETRLAGL